MQEFKCVHHLDYLFSNHIRVFIAVADYLCGAPINVTSAATAHPSSVETNRIKTLYSHTFW